MDSKRVRAGDLIEYKGQVYKVQAVENAGVFIRGMKYIILHGEYKVVTDKT